MSIDIRYPVWGSFQTCPVLKNVRAGRGWGLEAAPLFYTIQKGYYMGKLDPQRLIFGLFLLVLVVSGEIVFSHFKLPAWPAFMVMIFFFMEHMDLKKAPGILFGGGFGIMCIVFIKYFMITLSPYTGMEFAKISFIVIVVYAIVAFGEILPVLFNNYAFMFFTVSGLAAKTPETVKNINA